MATPDFHDEQLTIEGKGLSGVLILAFFPEQSKEEDYAFLENVLKAANLTPFEEKIFLLHTKNQNLSLSLSSIAKKANVKHLIIFGLNLPNLGISAQLPLYQFVEINDLKMMFSDPVFVIRKDRENKKNQRAAALWQALKTQFLQTT